MRLLDLLFPPRCVLCRKILPKEETDLCHDCRKNTPGVNIRGRNIRCIAKWTAVWYYENEVRRSLLRFKFRNARHYAPAYGRAIAMRVQEDMDEPIQMITWVPVSAKRLRRRGYDQSRLLAEAVGRELGIPVRRLLRKTRNNKTQSSLKGEAQRRANVQGAYEACESLSGLNILLVDDILTTGATMGECARVLQTAGAARVFGAAVAAGRNERKPKHNS